MILTKGNNNAYCFIENQSIYKRSSRSKRRQTDKADANIADQLTGLSLRQISEPVETMGKVPGMRLIPYRAVGQTGGLMLALPVKRSKIGGRKGSTLVAFAPQILDESGKYQALLGQW